LPPGTVVAHKTGTWREAATNDAGIITLPGGAGHVAIAVLTNRTKAGVDAERTIAEIALALYGHWARPGVR
jgi:beta-lactamase class A